MSDGVTGKAIGGHARAEILTPEERSEIARKAASAKWEEKLPVATHRGTLEIGGTTIPCAVLDNGRRVFTENGITVAILGSRSGASKRLKSKGTALPLFVAPGNLRPFISEELKAGPLSPVRYRDGTRIVAAFDAEVLPAVCDVWLKARDNGALQEQQEDKAKKAEILMRGLAHVGVIALIDEATGYQEVRARDALEKILEAYISEHLLKWAKRFPDSFYKEMFRLKGWNYSQLGFGKRPGVVGKYTNDVVYDRLAPGVLEELRRKNPPNASGNRPHKHHQWLTEDVGHPALRDHLMGVIALMRASRAWDEFKRTLARVYPKLNEQIPLAIE